MKALKFLLRFAITLLVMAAALYAGFILWERYMHSPWTRDGRVRADVITVASDVSGLVASVAVQDNSPVHRGDLLFTIDQDRYKLALAQADALVAARKATLTLKSQEAARRAHLEGSVISKEALESSSAEATMAEADFQQAKVQRDIAQLNLTRTEIRSPVDGYITNLNIHPGDFSAAGSPVMAVVDRNSFYVYGYFEETKLPLLAEGDNAEIRLMSGGKPIQGHVESLSRGISDRDNPTSRGLLADVNPTFNWVRLAQRVPVRIHIDAVPDGMILSAGMTCTVIVKPPANRNHSNG